MPENFIILYVDSTSRLRMIKKLKKTLLWFENKENESEQTHLLFQAFRYLALSTFTHHNYMAFEYGIVTSQT
jgi:hypothetical protein